ncbi:MAG: cbb3-type cytochrome c oxidase subunit I, partial [Syntrophales bacterium]|nr:cbb3-type cytochrome c oxidase subunit I [Syntrophales bacterium]
MFDEGKSHSEISPWWKQGVLFTLIIGFSVLIYIAFQAYRDAPPLPTRVVNTSGDTIFTGDDILQGQQVFLKYGLMENGTIWGHGAYLGPDFSATYLHDLATETAEQAAQMVYGRSLSHLTGAERDAVTGRIGRMLKGNRYDAGTGRLVFTETEVSSYRTQISRWTSYFVNPEKNGGLKTAYLTDAEEVRKLTAFFAWTAWVSVAERPGKNYSYTNSFPYDPLAGNTPDAATYLWSALSLVTLLAGIAATLFIFGKFDYLGWTGVEPTVQPLLLPGNASISQKAVIKYFVVVTLLFLLQVLVGAAAAHSRAEPGSFYGFNLYDLLPSNLLRTWHLQLAIFWIATAYVAGGLVLASSLGKAEPKGQVRGVNILFGALVIVVGGSLLGELLGINQLLGSLWFWFGHQGWEYLDLGRGWQVLLAIGLTLWVVLLFRALTPAF